MTLTTLTLPSLLAAPATRTAPALVASHPIMGHAAIEVNGLERKFGGFVAVDRIQFRVEHGEVFGFLGPNGAGKSTTIKMLCTLLQADRRRGAGQWLRCRYRAGARARV